MHATNYACDAMSVNTHEKSKFEKSKVSTDEDGDPQFSDAEISH